MNNLAVAQEVMKDILEVLDDKLLKCIIEPHRIPFTSKTANY